MSSLSSLLTKRGKRPLPSSPSTFSATFSSIHSFAFQSHAGACLAAIPGRRLPLSVVWRTPENVSGCVVIVPSSRGFSSTSSSNGLHFRASGLAFSPSRSPLSQLSKESLSLGLGGGRISFLHGTTLNSFSSVTAYKNTYNTLTPLLPYLQTRSFFLFQFRETTRRKSTEAGQGANSGDGIGNGEAGGAKGKEDGAQESSGGVSGRQRDDTTKSAEVGEGRSAPVPGTREWYLLQFEQSLREFERFEKLDEGIDNQVEERLARTRRALQARFGEGIFDRGTLVEGRREAGDSAGKVVTGNSTVQGRPAPIQERLGEDEEIDLITLKKVKKAPASAVEDSVVSTFQPSPAPPIFSTEKVVEVQAQEIPGLNDGTTNPSATSSQEALSETNPNQIIPELSKEPFQTVPVVEPQPTQSSDITQSSPRGFLSGFMSEPNNPSEPPTKSSGDRWDFSTPLPLSWKDVEKKLKKGEEKLEKFSEEWQKVQKKIAQKQEEQDEKDREQAEIEKWAREEKEEKKRKDHNEMKRFLQKEKEEEERAAKGVELERDPNKLDHKKNQDRNASVPQPIPVLHPYSSQSASENFEGSKSIPEAENSKDGIYNPRGFKHISHTSAGLEVPTFFIESQSTTGSTLIPKLNTVDGNVVVAPIDAESTHIAPLSSEVMSTSKPGTTEDLEMERLPEEPLLPKEPEAIGVEGELGIEGRTAPEELTHGQDVGDGWVTGSLLESASGKPGELHLEAQSNAIIPTPANGPELLQGNHAPAAEPATPVIGSGQPSLQEFEKILNELKAVVERLQETAIPKEPVPPPPPPQFKEDYKILAISNSPPYHILITDIEGNLSLPTSSTPGSSLTEFLPKLKAPYLFLQHVPVLKNEKWDLVAGGEELLIFSKKAPVTMESLSEIDGATPAAMNMTASPNNTAIDNPSGASTEEELKTIFSSTAQSSKPIAKSYSHHHHGFGFGGIAGDFGSFGVNPIDMTRDKIEDDRDYSLLEQKEISMENDAFLRKEWDEKRGDAIRSMKEAREKAERERREKERQIEQERATLEKNMEIGAQEEKASAEGVHHQSSSSAPAADSSSSSSSALPAGEEPAGSDSAPPPLAKKQPGPVKRFFKRLGWAVFYLGGGIILIKEIGFYMDKENREKRALEEAGGLQAADGGVASVRDGSGAVYNGGVGGPIGPVPRRGEPIVFGSGREREMGPPPGVRRGFRMGPPVEAPVVLEEK